MLPSLIVARCNVISSGALRRSCVLRCGQGGVSGRGVGGGAVQILLSAWRNNQPHASADSMHRSAGRSGASFDQEDDPPEMYPCHSASPSASWSPDDDVIVEVPHIPLPQRRVAQWFFPGLTGEEKEKTTPEKSTKGSSESPAGQKEEDNSSSSGKKTTTKEEEENGNGKEKEEITGSPPSSNKLQTEKISSDDVTKKLQEEEMKSTGAESEPAKVTAKTADNVKEASSSADRETSDEDLPTAFRECQEERNKHLRAFLTTALGSGFTKGDVENDGLRMAFSATASEAAKEAVGLRHMTHKVLISCLSWPGNEWDWIDISAHPTAALDEYRETLSQVLLDLGVHETLVSDALEPMLLPQATVTNECHCLVLRYAEDIPLDGRDNFQDLTNRLTILLMDKRIITIHRLYSSFMENLKRNWAKIIPESHLQGKTYFLSLLVKESVDTFSTSLSRCIVEFDKYEGNLFSSYIHRSVLAREIYHIKRRASGYARTLNLVGDAYSQFCGMLPIAPNDVQFQDVQQDIAHVRSLSEDLSANADSVLQLLFQLSSYQLNELMRVLTIFSAFFIPLSFIASVYGMNFTNLPLIHNEYGHLYCVAFMAVVGGGLGLWFKLKSFM